MTPQFQVTVVLMFIIIGVFYSCGTRAEASVTFGLFTEHYMNDKDEYNEDNNFLQITYSDDKYRYSLGRFTNSHYIDSHFISFGYASSKNCGIGLAAIHGYQKHLSTHLGNFIFAPVGYYSYAITERHRIKINVLPTVLNIGYEYRFKL